MDTTKRFYELLIAGVLSPAMIVGCGGEGENQLYHEEALSNGQHLQEYL